jgi:hypothetical protein
VQNRSLRFKHIIYIPKISIFFFLDPLNQSAPTSNSLLSWTHTHEHAGFHKMILIEKYKVWTKINNLYLISSPANCTLHIKTVQETIFLHSFFLLLKYWNSILIQSSRFKLIHLKKSYQPLITSIFSKLANRMMFPYNKILSNHWL